MNKTESKTNKPKRMSPEQTFAKLFALQAGAFLLFVILLGIAFWGFGFITGKI